MQPLRSHHRVERTSQGEDAWRLQALSPFDRTLLGALRASQTVSELLRMEGTSPGDLEIALLRMARIGWVLIHEPDISVVEDIAAQEDASDEERENASELEALLSRHRAQSQEPPEIDPILPAQEAVAWVETDRSTSEPELDVDQEDTSSTPDRRYDPAEFLPFDSQEAENDGLLEALRHPEVAAAVQSARDEWAPPSGGLAALLRALGEPVPEGVVVSPDQEERLHELDPVEPWGGSFSPPAKEDRKEKEEAPFPRLRDHATEEPRAKPHLGALRGSLNKVQQEQAAAAAVRERARALRQQREEELRKNNERNALAREKEQFVREGTTLLGLSQRLARVKNERDKDS